MRKFLHIILFICLCIFPVAGVEMSAESAAGFVEKLVNEALEIVNHKAMSDDEKRKGLSECVNKHLDIERITKAVFKQLGYEDLSPEDKEKVKEFMKKYLVEFYAGEGKLSTMVNSKLSSKPVAEPNDKDFSVKTNFAKDASSVEIVWITNGKTIYYVEIAGFNQIITLRSEMKAKVEKEATEKKIEFGPKALMAYISNNK
jgi:ABC-type transporter MlaC component